MSENVIKSGDLPEASKPAPAKKAAGSKKTTAKKQASPKAAPKVDPEVAAEVEPVVQEVVDNEPIKAEKSPLPEKNVAQASSGRKFVFFSTGSAYVTKSGVKFTADKRIYEVENEEADFLLSLENFRLPTQLELEEYYKENN
jgi:hypothetical protein